MFPSSIGDKNLGRFSPLSVSNAAKHDTSVAQPWFLPERIVQNFAVQGLLFVTGSTGLVFTLARAIRLAAIFSGKLFLDSSA